MKNKYDIVVAGAGRADQGSGDDSGSGGDDVVDAEFEVKDD